jgi:hypothetical protein
MLLEGLELARRSGRRDFEAWTLTNLELTALDTGDLESFERYAEEKEVVARSLGFAQMLAGALGERGMARLERGDIEAGVRLQHEADALWSTWEPQAISFFSVARARLLEVTGRIEEALECLLRGIDDTAGQFDAHDSERLLREAIRMLVAAGRIDEATEKLGLLRGAAMGRAHVDAFGDWADATIESDPARRADLLRQAAGVFERLGRRLDFGRCLLDLGRSEHDLSQDPRPSLTRARDLFVECTATLRVAEAEGLMAELGST